MIDNGVCEAQCNVEECQWDGTDCSCAPGCKEPGTCAPECLVPDCNYDSLSGQAACSDEQLRLSARAFQLATESFLPALSIRSLCTCAQYLWRKSFHECVPECASKSLCLNSFGHCGMKCPPHCEQCFRDGCLKCEPGYLSFYLQCVSACPPTFHPHPLVSDLCVPDADVSTMASPSVFYVTPSNISENLGTADNPFYSLMSAFAAAHSRYSRIYLLSGVHRLSAALSGISVHAWDFPFLPYAATRGGSIEVLPLHCYPTCEGVTIELDNLKPATISARGQLTLRHIIFIGNSTLLSTCEGDTCGYCRHVIRGVGKLLDDRQVPINASELVPQTICDQFQEATLLDVQGQVTLEHVHFHSFRQQLGSLIRFAAGTVVAANSSFSNIHTHTAVIAQASGDELVGDLVLSNVLVELLNNGYEYQAGTKYAGFLAIESVRSVTVERCVFTLNNLGFAGTLITAKNFLTFAVLGCTFQYSLGQILAIESTVTLPTTITADQELQYFSLDHLQVSNCTFTGISGNSLLSAKFSGNLQNVRLEQCEVRSCVSTATGLVRIWTPRTVEDWEVSGGRRAVLTASGRVQAQFPPMRTALFDLLFTACAVYGSQVLSVARLPNLNITNCLFESNGDVGQDVNSATVQHFISEEAVYTLQVVTFLDAVPCSRLMLLTELTNVNIVNTTITANVCGAGAVGVSLGGTVGVHNVLLQRNAGSAPDTAAVLDFSVTGKSAFTNLRVLENVNSAGCIVRIASTEPTIVSESQFIGNYAALGGSLLCSGYCRLSQVKFLENSAYGSTAAGLVYSPLSSAATVVLEVVTFVRNRGVVGGAMTLTDSLPVPAELQLTVLRSLFQDNEALQQGACLNIDSTVKLTQSSVIAQSRFVRNSAPMACVCTNFQSGVLLLASSEFSHNTGQAYAVLYSIGPALVAWQDSTVEYNAAPFIIGYNNPSGPTVGAARNLTLQYNSGVGVFLITAVWSDVGSTYRNNTAAESGPVLFIRFMCSVTMVGCTLQGNEAGQKGSAVYLSTISFLNVSDSMFLENRGLNHGGAIFTDQYAMMVVANSVFRGNSGTTYGAGIYFFTGSTALTHVIVGSAFEDNFSGGGGALFSISSSMSFISCSFSRNRGADSPGILLYLSEAQVLGSSFRAQTAVKGAFISAPATSVVLVAGTSFQSAESTDRGGALYISAGELKVSACEFSHLKAPTGAAITVSASSHFTLFGSSFTDLEAAQGGGAIYSSDCTVSVSSSVFSHFRNGAIVGLSLMLVVDSCVFARGSSKEGAAVFCEECASVIVQNSICSGLEAQDAACLSLKASAQTDLSHHYSILNSTIDGCVGRASGAVVLANGDFFITNCTFTDNSAVIGDGGAVSSQCWSGCVAVIASSTFAHNSARNGGAVSWTDSQPLLASVEFRNNSALYGPDTASFAVRLVRTSELAENLPSGHEALAEIAVALVDHYGQLVATDNQSVADLFAVFPANTSVTGITRVVASSGVFRFQHYTVTHKPGAATLLMVQSNGAVDSELPVPVSMRECLVGESEMSSGVCYACPAGKYSLHPSSSCLECPEGVECLGRALMFPLPGYWRSSNASDVFWPCVYAAACIGWGENSTALLPTGNCSAGYFGNLCHGCVSGYSRGTRSRCAPCLNFTLGVLNALGISVLALLVVAFIIKMSLLSARRGGSQYSVYLKIFLNYLQLLTVVASFNLAWPSEVVELLKGQQSAGSFGDQVLAFDCLLDTGGGQEQAVFTKLLIAALLPLCLVVVSAAFWGIVALAARTSSYLKFQLVNSIVILFFVAHPSIVRIMFDIFNCRELNKGEYWLSSYMNIRCWRGRHTTYALTLALPSVLLWGVLTPSAALLAIHLNRSRLESQFTKIRFGFLYNGYHHSKYYWEFVILYRKVVMIVISVFFTSVSIPVQALCVTAVLVVAFLLQLQQRPYLTSELNGLEVRGIMVGAVTVFCGLFFLTKDLDMHAQLALFTVVVSVNGYFLAHWVAKTFKMTVMLVKRVTRRLLHRTPPTSPLALDPADDLGNGPRVPENSVLKDSSEWVSRLDVE